MDKTQKFISDRIIETFNWYQNSDNKAQIILGFAGVFLGVLLASLFSSTDKIDLVRTNFENNFSIVLLVLVFLSYIAAIITCVIALWSRNIFGNNKKGIVFFSNIANYTNPIAFKKAIEKEFERKKQTTLEIRSLYYLSRSARLKHKLVNLAAIFSGIALVCTIFLALLILVK